MSGLKINFLKSEVFCLWAAKDNIFIYEEIFTCKSGELLMKYLGVPIHTKRLLNSHWKPVEDKMEKRLGKLLDMGARVTLLSACSLVHAFLL
jgi:hypothetical protein